MKTIALTLALCAPLAGLLAGSTDSVQTAEGLLKITPVTHGSLMLEFKGKVIHIDPWGRGDYTGLPKADLILITDIHGDHLDPAQVRKLKKSGTKIVAPPAVAQTVTEALVLRNGRKKRWPAWKSKPFPCTTTIGAPAPASSTTTRVEATATCWPWETRGSTSRATPPAFRK
jgi:L-ascorbate metabolism protein UlaG (beta-lactamase superfamily)